MDEKAGDGGAMVDEEALGVTTGVARAGGRASPTPARRLVEGVVGRCEIGLGMGWCVV